MYKQQGGSHNQRGTWSLSRPNDTLFVIFVVSNTQCVVSESPGRMTKDLALDD